MHFLCILKKYANLPFLVLPKDVKTTGHEHDAHSPLWTHSFPLKSPILFPVLSPVTETPAMSSSLLIPGPFQDTPLYTLPDRGAPASSLPLSPPHPVPVLSAHPVPADAPTVPLRSPALPTHCACLISKAPWQVSVYKRPLGHNEGSWGRWSQEDLPIHRSEAEESTMYKGAAQDKMCSENYG